MTEDLEQKIDPNDKKVELRMRLGANLVNQIDELRKPDLRYISIGAISGAVLGYIGTQNEIWVVLSALLGTLVGYGYEMSRTNKKLNSLARNHPKEKEIKKYLDLLG